MKNLNRTFIAGILLLFAAKASADDFISSTTQPETIPCVSNKGALKLKENRQNYKFYDKNLSSIRILRCEKIKLNGHKFYTVLFSADVAAATATSKALIFEVALQDKSHGNLKTVRSEIVDQFEMSADSASDKFEYSVKYDWGTAKNGAETLLRINIFKAGEPSSPYHLRLNKKQNWFENAFDLDKKK